MNRPWCIIFAQHFIFHTSQVRTFRNRVLPKIDDVPSLDIRLDNNQSLNVGWIDVFLSQVSGA